MELLRAFAYARGWVAASGLPDETRAGRRILKDYVDGKILYCKAPPGASPAVQALADTAGLWRGRAAPAPEPAAPGPAAPLTESPSSSDGGDDGAAAAAGGDAEVRASADAGRQQEGVAGPAAGLSAAAEGGRAGVAADAASEDTGAEAPLDLDEGDLLLMDDLDIGGKKSKPVRPAYKVRGWGWWSALAGVLRCACALARPAGTDGVACTARGLPSAGKASYGDPEGGCPSSPGAADAFPCHLALPLFPSGSSTRNRRAARATAARRRTQRRCMMAPPSCRASAAALCAWHREATPQD